MSAGINELLRKGIAAARDGDKATARDLFQQVVDLDEKNEKGWFWLASVVEEDEERRTCLENVLHINPANERAQQALNTLNERLKKSVNEEEVVPGVTRSQLTLLLGGGGALVVLIVVIALVTIISNNNRIAALNTEGTLIAAAQTGTVIAGTATAAQIALETTGTAQAIGATQTALYTPIPTLTPTSSIPTLPPTWTPRPTQGSVNEAVPTPLSPPVSLSGRLVVWSGRDVLNVDFLEIGYYQLDAGNQYNRIGDNIGRSPSMFVTGQRVVYSRYDPQLFSSVLEAININGTQIEGMQERWRAFDTVFDPEHPYFSRDGRYAVFTGRPPDRQTSQVWLLDLNAPAGTDPLTQLSDDDFSYAYPAISPDNTRVVVARTDNFSATPGTDIVLIDIASGGKIPITNDLTTFTETNPRWTPDGSQIIYAAYPSNNPNSHDLFVRNAQGSGTPTTLIADPSDDIFPVFSEDGRYLAFASNRTGAYDIYIYDISGQTLWQLTSSPEEDFPGDWWQP